MAAAPPGSPPLGRRVLFRLRVMRLGPEWKAWVEQDVARPSFVAWTALFEVGVIGVVGTFATLITGEFPLVFAGVWLAVQWVVLAIPSRREANRRYYLEHHRRKWDKSARGGAPAP